MMTKKTAADLEDEREAAWANWFEKRIEAGEEDDGEPDAVALVSAGLAVIEGAIERVEERADHARERVVAENEELHARIDALISDRAVEQERHDADLNKLEAKLARQAKDHAAEIERWRDELMLVRSDMAEQRALDKLRHSRAGAAHKAKVELRLARRELEKEAAHGQTEH